MFLIPIDLSRQLLLPFLLCSLNVEPSYRIQIEYYYALHTDPSSYFPYSWLKRRYQR